MPPGNSDQEQSTRADLRLVEQGLARSRAQAQEWIEAGRVFIESHYGPRRILKASEVIKPGTVLQLQTSFEPEFVSRAGRKLHEALVRTGFSVQGLKVLDIGMSTGGFTDCVLQSGAKSVVGVDVGHGQAAAQLRTDSRVTIHEGINARELSQAPELKGAMFDLIVMDVSFISIRLILPELKTFLKSNGHIISLVKPQFELGPAHIGRGGLVTSDAPVEALKGQVESWLNAAGFSMFSYFPCSTLGGDGNQEYIVLGRLVI